MFIIFQLNPSAVNPFLYRIPKTRRSLSNQLWQSDTQIFQVLPEQ